MDLEQLIKNLEQEFGFSFNPTIITKTIRSIPYCPVHDWQKYVPEYLKKNWSKLPEQTKIIIWFMCEKQANNEEWE